MAGKWCTGTVGICVSVWGKEPASSDYSRCHIVEVFNHYITSLLLVATKGFFPLPHSSLGVHK